MNERNTPSCWTHYCSPPFTPTTTKTPSPAMKRLSGRSNSFGNIFPRRSRWQIWLILRALVHFISRTDSKKCSAFRRCDLFGMPGLKSRGHSFYRAICRSGSLRNGRDSRIKRSSLEFSDAKSGELRPRCVFFADQHSIKKERPSRSGSVGFDKEISVGWAPFARTGHGESEVTAIRDFVLIGIANLRPFKRPGDMIGIAGTYSHSSDRLLREEWLFESYYRIKITDSAIFSPDIQ